MLRSMWTAATGMTAQQMNVDTIANNMSNVNTQGYKKSRALFEDLLYQEIRPAGAVNAAGQVHPTGVNVGLGARVVATEKIFSQGNLQQTNHPYDMAIQGDGFFQVNMPDGTVGYTRMGAWKIDANGDMVSPQGYLLEPGINVPEDATEFFVGQDGTVSVMQAGEAEPVELGQLELARFINPSGLRALGSNIYQQTGASGEPQVGIPGEDGFGAIAQGTLETSNVNVVEEMVSMITAQRAYEINSRSIQTGDEMLQTVNTMKR